MYMGNIQTINKISFEDMKFCILNKKLIISVIEKKDEHCLIKGTTTSIDEERVINDLYQNNNFSEICIIYGYNSNDMNVANKYKQLLEMGFKNVHIYTGGLFEWLLLQDIYGDKHFETTSYEINHLKYKPNASLQK